jgi:selenide, water dikinase
LLVILSADKAEEFCADLQQIDGRPAWIIGSVESGDRSARIVDEPSVIEIPEVERENELW